MKRSKLKRRLRKKYRVGEFQELGFAVEATFKPNLSQTVLDKFHRDFIALIEANNLAFGGGGNSETLQGFVTAWKKFCSPTIKQREKVENWFESHPEIVKSEVGKLIDGWYDIK